MFGNSTAVRFLYYAWITLTTLVLVVIDQLFLVDPFSQSYDLNTNFDYQPFILSVGILLLLTGVRVCEEGIVVYFRFLSTLWNCSFTFEKPWILWCWRILKMLAWQVLFWGAVLGIPAVSLALYSVVIAF